MDNLNLWAFPRPISNNERAIYKTEPEDCGFTKLELAALMIAQGGQGLEVIDEKIFAQSCVKIAKAVLEECNK